MLTTIHPRRTGGETARKSASSQTTSYHFANLTDLQLKHADVVEVAEVMAWIAGYGS